MMRSNRAGPELGFSLEPAEAVARAIIEGIETDAFDVIRGGEARAEMIAANRSNPAAVDEKFLTLKDALEDAVKDHNALRYACNRQRNPGWLAQENLTNPPRSTRRSCVSGRADTKRSEERRVGKGCVSKCR